MITIWSPRWLSKQSKLEQKGRIRQLGTGARVRKTFLPGEVETEGLSSKTKETAAEGREDEGRGRGRGVGAGGVGRGRVGARGVGRGRVRGGRVGAGRVGGGGDRGRAVVGGGDARRAVGHRGRAVGVGRRGGNVRARNERLENVAAQSTRKRGADLACEDGSVGRGVGDRPPDDRWKPHRSTDRQRCVIDSLRTEASMTAALDTPMVAMKSTARQICGRGGASAYCRVSGSRWARPRACKLEIQQTSM